MRISDWGSDVCPSDLVEAVHARHFDVEHDDIDGLAREIIVGVMRRGDRGADLEPRPLVDDPFEDAANDEAVVDEHHAQGARGWLAVRYPRLRLGHGKNLRRSEEHTSELQSLMRNSYAV